MNKPRKWYKTWWWVLIIIVFILPMWIWVISAPFVDVPDPKIDILSSLDAGESKEYTLKIALHDVKELSIDGTKEVISWDNFEKNINMEWFETKNIKITIKNGSVKREQSITITRTLTDEEKQKIKALEEEKKKADAMALIGKTWEKNKYGWQVMCEDAVKERLKSPSTAKFSEWKRVNVWENGYISWSVDSQNWFWATIRSNFICEFTWKDPDFFLKNVTIE